MIVPSLAALYARLSSGDEPLPETGWQMREIAYVIELSADGTPVTVIAQREPQAKGRPRAKQLLVPQEAKRTGKIPDEATEADCWKASLFWDNPKYALGLSADDDAKAAQAAQVCHGLFVLRHLAFARDAGVAEDVGMQALLRFLERGAAAALAARDPDWPDQIVAAGGNVAFRLDTETELICRRPAIREAVSAIAAGDEAADDTRGQCLVTGREGRIARLHPSIQGVFGAQSSGANIVSFNNPAFETHGLTQGANAPVGAAAAFAYTTALNWLLRAGSPHRARAAGTTVVFWAGAETPHEVPLCSLLVAAAEPAADANLDAIKAVFTAPNTGAPPALQDQTPFYVLGLSAESKSRLTVRFFQIGTVAAVAGTIHDWFDAIAIAPNTDEPPLSLMRLIAGLSVLGDLKNAPPLLAADLLAAVFSGTRLPERVLGEALVRCAAEQGPTRERAALIKAFLIRNLGRSIRVSLDPDEPDPAYRLGRLFAVLEWVQEAAIDAKAGIAERSWGGATSTPAFVFPELLKLSIFHLDKLEKGEGWKPGFGKNRRADIETIVAGLPPHLPARLELAEQGTFAIGYWHQRAARKAAAHTDATAPKPQEQAA